MSDNSKLLIPLFGKTQAPTDRDFEGRHVILDIPVLLDKMPPHVAAHAATIKGKLYLVDCEAEISFDVMGSYEDGLDINAESACEFEFIIYNVDCRSSFEVLPEWIDLEGFAADVAKECESVYEGFKEELSEGEDLGKAYGVSNYDFLAPHDLKG